MSCICSVPPNVSHAPKLLRLDLIVKGCRCLYYSLTNRYKYLTQTIQKVSRNPLPWPTKASAANCNCNRLGTLCCPSDAPSASLVMCLVHSFRCSLLRSSQNDPSIRRRAIITALPCGLICCPRRGWADVPYRINIGRYVGRCLPVCLVIKHVAYK